MYLCVYGKHACMYVYLLCMSAYMYKQIHTHMHVIYILTDIYSHVYTHTYTNTCNYIYGHTNEANDFTFVNKDF